jgi:hypothetical protein
MPDVRTAKWFDASSVIVNDPHGLMGNFSHEEIVRLSGAPSGSVVDVLPGGEDEITVTLKVTNDRLLALPMSRVITRSAEGHYFLENELFVLKPEFQQEGIGARSFALQAKMASALGFESIETLAARWLYNQLDESIPVNGYKTWPYLGYDGEIPETVREHLPPQLQQCRSVRELYEVEGGADAWAEFGDTCPLTFDLSPDSESWRILGDYLQRKGIELE